MAHPITLMTKDNLRTWFKARGFWVIVVAALVPPLLTGAWVWTSQNDVAPVDIVYGPDDVLAGENVTITAVFQNKHDTTSKPFNATVQVGFFEGTPGDERFNERKAETKRVPSLRPGERHEVQMNWTTQPGTFIFRALADVDDEIREIEETNNDRFVQVHIAFPPIELEFDPNVANPGGAQPEVDGSIDAIGLEPADVYERQPTNVTVTFSNHGAEDIVNATLRLQVRRATVLGGYSTVPSPNLSQTVSVGAGNTTSHTFAWTPPSVSQYALIAILDTGGVAKDTNTSNNALAQEVFVDRQFVYKEPDPKETAKGFYKSTLEILHLRLLIPLIALFYAGSTLQDERERGHLPYLLSRPVPRWMLPVSRFVVSFAVAGAAILVGVLATYFLLLGQPQATGGFFGFPLAFVLLALFVYGGLFTLVGVVSDKPYLVGLLYVIGFEAVLLIGSGILVNGAPIVQDWVFNLSLNHWVQEAFAGWNAEAATFGDGAWRALWVILAVGVGSILASAWWMKRREFED